MVFTFGNVFVTSVWSQVDLNRNEVTKFERNYLIEFNEGSVKPKVLYRSHPVEISESLRALSKSGDFTAVLRNVAPKKKSGSAMSPESSEFVDIFSNVLAIKEHSVDLKTQEKHGKVNTTFGGLNFSHGEGHVLYVAEKYRKPVGFFDAKFDDEKYMLDPSIDEFIGTENWGEQLADVKEPVLCILDVNSGNTTVLDNVPSDISPMQPVWCPDDEGVVFVGLCNLPAKLGYGACFNRRSRLYHYDIKEATCVQLTNDEAAMAQVRFSNDGSRFVYVEARAGGTHKKCEILKLFDWSKRQCSTVIDTVASSDNNPKAFPGLFDCGLPTRCWASDSKRVILTTVWHSKTEIVVANVEDGTLMCITNHGDRYGSWRLLDVVNDVILAVNSAPNRPPGLFIARLPLPGRESSDIVWHKLDSEMPRPFGQLVSDIRWDVLTLRRPNDSTEPVDFADVQYEALLHLPAKNEGENDQLPPMVAIPHGGPHGASIATWIPSVACFVLSGYAVLRINYRGSIGFGEDFVRALPGHVGTTDVLDCKHAINSAFDRMTTIENTNASRQIFLYGASHGGFITAHLLGQFPEYAKAAVAVNPVMNMASHIFECDIPDWGIVECFNTEYNPVKPLTGDRLAEMLQKSPIFYADKVVTPLMLAIGENDLRVPSVQIKEYARTLQARNVPLRIMKYADNNHMINNIDAEANEIINALLWFENYRHYQ